MLTQTQYTPGRQFIARLLPGEDLLDVLKKFCQENTIKSAYIPMLIGALEYAEIAHPDQMDKNKRVIKKYDGPIELTAQGTIATYDNELSFHIHAVIGGNNHQTCAMGHLLSGKIAILIELVIIEVANVEMTKDFDKTVFSEPLLFFKKITN